MKILVVALFATFAAQSAHAAMADSRGPQLLCHRTANEDVPENTLESLEEAALVGCNVVEIDLRRTLDGQIVLNHDGILERLTDGTGEIESRDYAYLETLDLGSWMSPRFSGMRIALFEDALRIARKYDIRLVLDMKDKNIGADVLRILKREGMLERVQFSGEWDDVRKLDPAAVSPGDKALWLQPGVTAEQVREAHQSGKFVVVNFSANDHAIDLASMKAAVAAGAEAINVDYPRLGADAVGRPVEATLRGLIVEAGAGESQARAAAILQLARYRGFPLQVDFAHWLLDADSQVSQAAAEALVMARPVTPQSVFAEALRSPNPAARANAAWAVGALHAPAETLLPLLHDKDPKVLQAALSAIARTTGPVSSESLLPLLAYNDPGVRGAAARALAQHQPAVAIKVIPAQLEKEAVAERALFDERRKHGDPPFKQSEIAAIQRSFRCQMEMVRAMAAIPGDKATRELVHLFLRPDKDFSQYNAIIAGFQLWDRIADDPQLLIEALASTETDVADRAEWTLANAGPLVLPSVRRALDSDSDQVRARAIHILAWQGDQNALQQLRAIETAHGPESDLAMWAIATIESLHVRF